MKKGLVLLAATVFLLPAVLAVAGGRGAVNYPEGYRNWVHVKSMVIEKGHPLYDAFGGMHHIYANRTALGALKTGGPFPDGSVIVFDLLTAVKKDNAITEGVRKVVGVMAKNSQKFNKTGGWGFEAFRGDTRQRLVKDPVSGCFKCHESQKTRDYVFSSYRR